MSEDKNCLDCEHHRITPRGDILCQEFGDIVGEEHANECDYFKIIEVLSPLDFEEIDFEDI